MIWPALLGRMVRSVQGVIGILVQHPKSLESAGSLTLRMLSTGFVHPNINLDDPEDGVEMDILVGPVKEKVRTRTLCSILDPQCLGSAQGIPSLIFGRRRFHSPTHVHPPGECPPQASGFFHHDKVQLRSAGMASNPFEILGCQCDTSALGDCPRSSTCAPNAKHWIMSRPQQLP